MRFPRGLKRDRVGGVKMTCRRWLLIAAGLTVAGLGSVIYSWPDPGPRPCRETFERVRMGMTPEEVVATVGGPPGDYTGGRYVVPLYMVTHWDPPPNLWIGEDAAFEVNYIDGKVGYLAFHEVSRWRGPTTWQRFRTWLGF